MFDLLESINSKPAPFEFKTASDLWTDDFISHRMLDFHLDDSVDAASRNKKFVDKSSEFIFNNYIDGKGKDVIDFGCGPGLYTTRLAELGANVTGIDFSQNSINFARKTANKKGLSINYVCKDYLSFDTDDKYDLAIMIMCDFSVLSPKQRDRMLKLFYKILKPGGRIIFDVYTTVSYYLKKEQAIYSPNLMNGFWSPEKYFGFLNTFKYEAEKLLLDKYTIIEKGRTRYFYNWFQCFEGKELSSELKCNNFEIEHVYADICGSVLKENSEEMAIVARKI
jgi:2-polyprenyl-3-methyl-5-hydroxy-6-metoxy-1,4-benzoquinol methylase